MLAICRMTIVLLAAFTLCCCAAAGVLPNKDSSDDLADAAKVIVGSDDQGILLWKDKTVITFDLTSESTLPKAVTKNIRNALKMWNKCMRGRVTFKEVKKNGNYVVNNGAVCTTTSLASITYTESYKTSSKPRLCVTSRLVVLSKQAQMNSLLHDFGHVLGLQHTHHYRKLGTYATQLDSYLYSKFEENSIMSYTSYAPDRKFTSKDCKNTKKLYDEAATGKCVNVRDMKNKKRCVPFKTIAV